MINWWEASSRSNQSFFFFFFFFVFVVFSLVLVVFVFIPVFFFSFPLSHMTRGKIIDSNSHSQIRMLIINIKMVHCQSSSIQKNEKRLGRKLPVRETFLRWTLAGHFSFFWGYMTRGPPNRVALVGNRSEESGTAAVPVYTDGGGLHYFCEGRGGGGDGGGLAAGLLRLFRSWRQDGDRVRTLPGGVTLSGRWSNQCRLPPNNIFSCFFLFVFLLHPMSTKLQLNTIKTGWQTF